MVDRKLLLQRCKGEVLRAFNATAESEHKSRPFREMFERGDIQLSARMSGRGIDTVQELEICIAIDPSENLLYAHYQVVDAVRSMYAELRKKVEAGAIKIESLHHSLLWLDSAFDMTQESKWFLVVIGFTGWLHVQN